MVTVSIIRNVVQRSYLSCNVCLRCFTTPQINDKNVQLRSAFMKLMFVTCPFLMETLPFEPVYTYCYIYQFIYSQFYFLMVLAFCIGIFFTILARGESKGVINNSLKMVVLRVLNVAKPSV